ncbi:hypothetical protein HQ520_17425, partial [bacterium]|nr:hypothetical protein [bacterium]
TSPQNTTATRDILLAGSIGVAALGSAFAYITKALSAVEWQHVIFVTMGILLVLMGPSLAISWWKLRRRDLTTLLEASGWAINTRMRITGGLGELFTRIPGLPEGSRKQRRDLVPAFTKKTGQRRVRWLRVLVISLIGMIVVLSLIVYRLAQTPPAFYEGAPGQGTKAVRSIQSSPDSDRNPSSPEE